MAAWVVVALVACGGTVRAPASCGQDCRVYRGEAPAVPECRVPEDCGAPPHTQTMQCIAGGRCVPVCEHHWGDCDEAFRNGCEQAIADRHYCPGDPRIGAVSEPSVSFRVHHDEAGADADKHALARALAGYTADLERCYGTMLAREPGRSGESAYRITFSQAGTVEHLERIASAFEDPTLTECEEHALRGAKLDRSARSEVRLITIDIQFAPGGPDTEVE
ncbi:MAG TPA: hypothetical protein VMF89_25775 [Polyangiales bacterium]|nr:hypothetical protein [Polyangiales bacterium]